MYVGTRTLSSLCVYTTSLPCLSLSLLLFSSLLLSWKKCFYSLTSAKNKKQKQKQNKTKQNKTNLKLRNNNNNNNITTTTQQHNNLPSSSSFLPSLTAAIWRRPRPRSRLSLCQSFPNYFSKTTQRLRQRQRAQSQTTQPHSSLKRSRHSNSRSVALSFSSKMQPVSFSFLPSLPPSLSVKETIGS